MEFLVLLLVGILYFIMAFFGRGTFWIAFNVTNLYFIFLSFPLVFILNTYAFVPLLKKDKWLTYFFCITILMLLLELIGWAITSDNAKYLFGSKSTFIVCLTGITCSWIFVLIRDWVLHKHEIEKLKTAKLQSEINFLKVQLNPHFLFNTLNSIYALALAENGTKTADSIIKLGALMRYNLHDASQDYIDIEQEINYIEKYITLQKLRLNNNNHLAFIVNDERQPLSKVQIAPLLLIPIIENTFKYGVSQTVVTEISIQLLVTDNYLQFYTSNDLLSEETAANFKSGLGLLNVKARLEMLYAKKFEFTYGIVDKKYNTCLKIKF